MRSPLIALTWEIWRKNRLFTVGSILPLLICGVLFPIFAAEIRTSGTLRFFSYLLMVVSLMFVFALFNYTEFNPLKHWTGFPYRHFVLPLPTWLLVAWPMAAAMLMLTVWFLIWSRLIFPILDIHIPLWTTAFLLAGLAGFQTTLWSLSAFRVTRIIVMALMANALVGLALMPIANGVAAPGSTTLAVLTFSVPGSFLIAWISVSRQRHSGGVQRKWLPWLTEKIGDLLPRRTKDFASSAEAQFWFEWRRAGWILPLCTLLSIGFVFLPISWMTRGDAIYTLWIIGWLLALPLILSALVGKGFAKPDFWSSDLACSNFLLVRPVNSVDFIFVKFKVAALMVLLTWLPVIVFLAIWLPGWADTRRVVSLWWLARANFPLFELCSVLGLMLIGLLLLTWNQLIGGLWAGHSGKNFLYVTSSVLELSAIGFLIALAVRLGNSEREWSILSARAAFWFGCAIALAVLLKLSIAVMVWRKVSPARSAAYVLIWLCGTLCFAVLAWLVFEPLNALRPLLVLATLLMFPLVRPGLAPMALSHNRHR